MYIFALVGIKSVTVLAVPKTLVLARLKTNRLKKLARNLDSRSKSWNTVTMDLVDYFCYCRLKKVALLQKLKFL